MWKKGQNKNKMIYILFFKINIDVSIWSELSIGVNVV